MTERPAYKSHPLWETAMALARDAYAVAEGARGSSPETARRLRKAAVAVPAHIAAAVSDPGEERRQHALAARGALAEVAAYAGNLPGDDSRRLARRAETLGLSVLFELDATGAVT
jgi:23S rRNA-intervening sequence protein